jgi:hypothetical protein
MFCEGDAPHYCSSRPWAESLLTIASVDPFWGGRFATPSAVPSASLPSHCIEP